MLNETLLPEYDNECATTRKLLSRVPDDALEWRPHEKSWTMQELATHIANIPTWVPVTLEAKELDMGQEFPKPPTGTRDDLLKIFDDNVAAGREKLAGASDKQLMHDWTLKKDGNEVFTMPRVAVLRSFVLSHMIHHRGQLSVYLRLRDVPLPSIYGPSADEEAF